MPGKTNKWINFFTVLAVIAVVSFQTLSQAGYIVADLQNPEDSYTIEEVQLAGGILVGDKLFSDFRVTTASSYNAIAPDAEAIMVTGVLIEDELGLRFNGGWVAASSQIANSTIKFKVSIIEPWLSDGFLLSDNSLWMSAFGTDNGGMVSVSENVYMEDPDLGFTESIAYKHVFYVDETYKDLYDHCEFTDPTGATIALPEIWIIKDVTANGGIDPYGFAHLSEFYQTFSQVPEPATVVLMAVGALVILKRRPA